MRIDVNISLLWKRSKKAIKKTLNKKDIIKLLSFRRRINNDVNKTSNNILEWENRFDVNIIYRFIISNIISKISIVSLIQINIKMKNEKVDFQFEMWWYIENVNMNVFETSNEIKCVFILIKVQFEQLTI